MRPVFVCAAVFVACALGSAFGPGAPAPVAAREAAAASTTPYGVTGEPRFKNLPATSCAAASCHGAGAVGQVGSEHSTWAPEAQFKPDSDPHNKAYRVLYNPVSVEMAKKLKIGEAHKADLCLKCHAVPAKTGDEATDAQILAEGVGCSACHGAAEKWVGEHYTSDWKALTNRQKWEKYGFVPTGNLVARLLNCAQCHVGDADRDVNHELYAAGHPRITFEAAKMHNTKGYRKHWEEKTKQPDFEVRAWVVGQATTLRAAAELLRVRAERAEQGFAADAKFPDRGAWPEFAGYSCYACHQRVGEVKPSEPGVRNELSAAKLGLGVPGWEVWSNTAVGVAANHCQDAYPNLLSPKWKADSLKATNALREQLGKKFALKPGEVKKLAADAVAELDAWLVELQNAEDARGKPVASGTANRIAHALANNALATANGKPLLADHDWDALASNYLGAAAMAHASGGTAKVNWGAPLLDIRAKLLFPPGAGARFDSPWNYDTKHIETLRLRFTDLRAATAPTGGN